MTVIGIILFVVGSVFGGCWGFRQRIKRLEADCKAREGCLVRKRIEAVRRC